MMEHLFSDILLFYKLATEDRCDGLPGRLKRKRRGNRPLRQPLIGGYATAAKRCWWRIAGGIVNLMDHSLTW